MCLVCKFVFFFFSSRRRHTRYWRDWSSDVCSSDLARRMKVGRSRIHLLTVVRRLPDKSVEQMPDTRPNLVVSRTDRVVPVNGEVGLSRPILIASIA